SEVLKFQSMRKMPSERAINIDNVLIELGNIGKFQLLNLAFIGIAILLSSIVSLTFVFAAGEVNYRCRIPICDDGQAEYEPAWLLHAVPYVAGVPSRCNRYENTINDSSHCWDQNRFEIIKAIACDDWIFESGETTILNDFRLACSQNDWKLAFVGTMNNAALFIFIAAMGALSDRLINTTNVK
ncbi:Solute carrier family 22 member 8, partial [Pseudolycoriella hygida]